jgi:hypothetical protein
MLVLPEKDQARGPAHSHRGHRDEWFLVPRQTILAVAGRPRLSIFVEVVTTFTERGARSVNELAGGTSLRGHSGLSSESAQRTAVQLRPHQQTRRHPVTSQVATRRGRLRCNDLFLSFSLLLTALQVLQRHVSQLLAEMLSAAIVRHLDRPGIRGRDPPTAPRLHRTLRGHVVPVERNELRRPLRTEYGVGSRNNFRHATGSYETQCLGRKERLITSTVEVILVESAVIYLGLESPNCHEDAITRGEAFKVLAVEPRQSVLERGINITARMSGLRSAVQLRPHQRTKRPRDPASKPVVLHHGREEGGGKSQRGAALIGRKCPTKRIRRHRTDAQRKCFGLPRTTSPRLPACADVVREGYDRDAAPEQSNALRVPRKPPATPAPLLPPVRMEPTPAEGAGTRGPV